MVCMSYYERTEGHRRRLAREARKANKEFRPMSREQASEAERLSRGLDATENGDYEGIGEDD